MRERHTAYAEPAYNDSTTDTTPPPVRVRIKNLKQVGEEIFDIEGLAMKPINVKALCEALDRHTMPESLVDDIAVLLFRHDVAEWLAQGIIRE